MKEYKELQKLIELFNSNNLSSYGKDNLREYLLKIEYLIKKNESYIEIIGELKAKVYTYEKMIANSNFAPILKENKKSKKESKGD